MRLLLVTYGGPRRDLVPDLLDRHAVEGWTLLSDEAHGAGRSGRREGSRAWPGETLVFFTIVSDEAVAPLVDALRGQASSATPGERLHVAEMPVTSFF